MKKIKFIYLSLLMFIAIMPSCKRDPETEPRDIYTEELVWDEKDQLAVLSQRWLNNLYTYLPSGFTRISGDYLDAASGDAIPTRNNTPVSNYTNGVISTINNPDSYWTNAYFGIRSANIFLANIDKVPAGAARITQWKAETRFIRAFLYFELWKRYGGVPLVGDKIFQANDNLQLPRNTYDEVLNYIVTECDAIKNNLIGEAALFASTGDLGRIPKGAPVALKCRAYLYAASPLFNGGGVETDPKLKVLTGSLTPDLTRWQKVIDAADELNTISANFYVLESSYANVFTTKNSKEVVLAKQSANSFNLETENAPVGYIGGNFTSNGRTSPTQNFVDAFTTRTGLAITATGSGYNAATPYANRDPRMDAIVFYDASPTRWLNRLVETNVGGKDNPTGSALKTKTGYYLRKFLASGLSTSTSYSNQSHNFIYFRLGEILLNKAEALNEIGGATNIEAAAQIIIRLRTRAGITAGTPARYGVLLGLSQSEMRDLIRNERRIELSFEEHRFWDVRRWKTASVDLAGPLFGMQIVNNGTAKTYTKVQVDNMIFTNKLYHMPLPYDETRKNSALLQNEGW